jgi:hypothetical protein
LKILAGNYSPYLKGRKKMEQTLYILKAYIHKTFLCYEHKNMMHTEISTETVVSGTFFTYKNC